MKLHVPEVAEKILAIVRERPGIHVADLDDVTGLKQPEIYYALRHLIDTQKIEKVYVNGFFKLQVIA